MNEITQQIIEEFKLRIKLDGNEEDANLARILNDSVNDLILKTGEYTIEESGVFKELVFERARYVYNDALEYFDTNFVSQITILAIGNPKALEGGDGGGSTGPTIITYEDVVNALGYTPLNSTELQNFIARYNDEQAALSMRITNNSTRITTLENQMGNVDLTPINNRITAVETVNNTQNNRLDALEQAGGTDLGPLTTRVESVENGLAIANNNISSLGERVTVLENSESGGNNEELANRISDVENDLEVHRRTGNTNAHSIDNIQGLRSELDTRNSYFTRRDSSNQLIPEITSSLPNTDLTTGRVVFNTADNSLYYYNGTQWVISSGSQNDSEDRYFINDDISLTSSPNSFSLGTTISVPSQEPGSQLLTECFTALNFGLNLSFNVTRNLFSFKIKTDRNNTDNFTSQKIEVYIYRTSESQQSQLLATLTRQSIDDTGNLWTVWNGVINILQHNGSPIGVVPALRGTLLYSYTQNILYINTSPQDNLTTNWQSYDNYVRGNQNSNLRTEVVNSLPTSNLNTGRIVFNTADNSLYYYDGTNWVSNTGSSSSEEQLVRINNNLSFNSLPNSFSDGLTLTSVDSTTQNDLKLSCIQALNDSLFLSIPVSNTSLIFTIKTLRNSNLNFTSQEINVAVFRQESNQTFSTTTDLATIKRVSLQNNPNAWGYWTGQTKTLRFNGVPNNNISGFLGQQLIDNNNGNIYYNIGTRTQISQNWQLLDSKIRNSQDISLRTEVVSSLPTSNLNTGRIVFDTSDNTFRGYNGGEWV